MIFLFQKHVHIFNIYTWKKNLHEIAMSDYIWEGGGWQALAVASVKN